MLGRRDVDHRGIGAPADADLVTFLAAHDLDDTARPLDWHEDVDLRWLVLRMIGEYAQHCGHVDLLREGVDATTGA